LSFKIEWVDRHREPQCKPDPDFPRGKDVDISNGAVAACTARLPYPAKRCGYFIVECHDCPTRLFITTAGRPDDPRSVKLPCHRPEQVQ
jgi:hypothetical protein